MNLEDFRYNLRSLRKCNQHWDEMKAVPGGRLCAKCDKKIVDFSHMTHSEIALFMAESNQPVCGFYLPEQLPQSQKTNFMPFAVAVSTLLVSSNISIAQSAPSQNLYSVINTNNHRANGNVQHQSTSVKQDDSVIIKGKVTYIDTVTKQTNPVSFAAVVIKGTRFGVACNGEGEFELSYLPDADSGTIHLMISAVGLHTAEVAINFSTQQEYEIGTITLSQYEGEMTEFYVTIKGPWHKRLWRTLTKPFR